MKFVRLVIAFLASVLVVGLLSFAMTSAQADTGTGGSYRPLTPTRIADTRTGLGGYSTAFGAGTTRDFTVTGVAGVPTSGVSAVVVDVAVTGATATGYLTAFPKGGTNPNLSMLRYGADYDMLSNTAIVKIGTGGKISLYTSAGSTHVNVDVQGYFTDGSEAEGPGGFTPITPFRVLGTNGGIGMPDAKLNAGTVYMHEIGGVGEVPSTATAVFANVRVLNATGDGGVKLTASNVSTSTAYGVNFQPDTYNDTGMSIRLGPDGKIKIVSYDTGVQYDIIIDVQGYFEATPGEGGGYTPLAGSKFYDSRDSTIIGPNQTREVQVAGLAGVPDDGTAGSVATTILAYLPTAVGSAVVYNPDVGVDGTSNVAFKAADAGVGRTSTSIVELSTQGTVAIHNNTNGNVHIVLAAQGWFTDPYLDEPTDPSDEVEPPASVPSVPTPSTTAQSYGITTLGELGETVEFEPLEESEFGLPSGGVVAQSISPQVGGGWWDGICGSNSSTADKYKVIKKYNRPRDHSRMKSSKARMYCGKKTSTQSESKFGIRHIRDKHKYHFDKWAELDLADRNWGNWMHWAVGWTLREPHTRTVQNANRYCYQKTFTFVSPNGVSIDEDVVVILGRTGVRIMTAFPTGNTKYCAGAEF